ncbi:HAD family phosphatase [Cognatishimia sp. F0-27]|uniref:HAD family hydrolase n=1 Tax=Cognatishimia sp. F0-27 TaxID=2816855 RepID=UPI001D0CB007|nr:HAD-IA family hydrolase [Cognatishimia sp. F0-27]MCC1495049.1 HAD-IA family hydrolase [Cognatishimia sp. F0-27]
MKALFFGSIGSVVETSELQRQAFNQAFKEHGLDWVWEKPDYAEMLKSSGGAKRIAAYAEDRGEEVDANAIHQRKSAIFLEQLQAGTKAPRDGVLDLLKHCQAHGLKTGFVSTTEPATIEAISAILFGQRVRSFDVMTSRALGLDPKPAPDAYQFALDRLGLAATDVLAIEDNLDGVTSAKAAGLFVVAYPGEFDDPKDFAEADHVVKGSLFEEVVPFLENAKVAT